MEIKKIEKLTHDWDSATWKVIDFKNPGYSTVHHLFKETYELLSNYSNENTVPKEICGLLWEMHEFCWWVGDLEETPLHFLYEQILSLTFELKKYFLTRDASIEMIEKTINEIL